MKMEGKTVTVAGSPVRLDRRNDFGIHYISHRNRQDFAIVGPYDKVERLKLDAQAGNILLISGVISLHRGRPQFRVETVSIKPVR